MNILSEADEITSGRSSDPSLHNYGHPLEHFTRTALMWSAILGIEVTPQQVGLCMAALKISRQVHKPKRDNLVDAAGYIRTVEMIEDEIAKPKGQIIR